MLLIGTLCGAAVTLSVVYQGRWAVTGVDDGNIISWVTGGPSRNDVTAPNTTGSISASASTSKATDTGVNKEGIAEDACPVGKTALQDVVQTNCSNAQTVEAAAGPDVEEV